jgi:hypothetical protein
LQLSNYILHFVVTCLSLLLGISALAQTNSNSTSGPSNQILNFNRASLIKAHCPQPSQLTKSPDTRIWSYRKFWRSYNPSLAKSLNVFSGAQWSGSTVGSIICIYNNKENSLFPVLVYFSGLTKMPTGENWQQTRGGYRNCKQGDVTKCSFYAFTPSKKKVDLYEEALKLRKKT